MIKEVHFKNWKSFSDAKLYIDPLTILIGTNASGKSNALDGMRFLHGVAQGWEFRTILDGDKDSVRGGLEWAALKPHQSFTIDVLIGGGDEKTDYRYSITVQTIPQPILLAESLDRFIYRGQTKKNPYTGHLFWTDSAKGNSPAIIGRLYNEHRGTPVECGRSKSILSQLAGRKLRQEITLGIERAITVLKNIFVLDPLPKMMRQYAKFSAALTPDAANVAGVMASLSPKEKTKIEKTLSEYMQKFPDRDIRRVWAEPVGRFNADAMLYCEETWEEGEKEPFIVDARSMSDGTLRFLAIVVALLTRPDNSQIIIEEIDNGLHPSRIKLLLRILREIGERRGIDVLVTTHNPVLLDEIGPKGVPFVIVAHRKMPEGFSSLTLLEDVKDLPKLLSSCTLGDTMTKSELERRLEAVV